MAKIGIEIEFIARGVDKRTILARLRSAGIEVIDRSHTHSGHSLSEWQLKRDGSVAHGFELVSHPLEFEDARTQVTAAVQALQDAGCQTGDAAGIHVHVDGNDLTARQVAAVGRFFYKFEDQIYRLASSGWNSIRRGASSYCKPLPERTAKELAKVRTLDDLQRAWYGSADSARWAQSNGYDNSRYHGVNIHSWFYRRTIEFRVFNSSMNPNRIWMYVALAHAIVQDARNGYTRSTGKAFRLGAMKGGTVSENAAILRLQQVLRYGHDTMAEGIENMSKDDWKLVRKYWKDSKPQERFVYS